MPPVLIHLGQSSYRFNLAVSEDRSKFFWLPKLNDAKYGSFVSPKIKSLVVEIEDICFDSFRRYTAPESFINAIEKLKDKYLAEYDRCVQEFNQRKKAIQENLTAEALPSSFPLTDPVLQPDQEFAAKSVFDYLDYAVERLFYGKRGKEPGEREKDWYTEQADVGEKIEMGLPGFEDMQVPFSEKPTSGFDAFSFFAGLFMGKGAGEPMNGDGGLPPGSFQGVENEFFDSSGLPVESDFEDKYVTKEKDLISLAIEGENIHDEPVFSFDEEEKKPENLLPIIAIAGVCVLWMMIK